MLSQLVRERKDQSGFELGLIFKARMVISPTSRFLCRSIGLLTFKFPLSLSIAAHRKWCHVHSHLSLAFLRRWLLVIAVSFLILTPGLMSLSPLAGGRMSSSASRFIAQEGEILAHHLISVTVAKVSFRHRGCLLENVDGERVCPGMRRKRIREQDRGTPEGERRRDDAVGHRGSGRVKEAAWGDDLGEGDAGDLAEAAVAEGEEDQGVLKEVADDPVPHPREQPLKGLGQEEVVEGSRGEEPLHQVLERGLLPSQLTGDHAQTGHQIVRRR